MFIDARLKAGQPAARPNPSREAKRCGDRKRQKSLCVVFHAVPPIHLATVIVRALDAACTTPPTDSNGCFKMNLRQYQGASATFVSTCFVGRSFLVHQCGGFHHLSAASKLEISGANLGGDVRPGLVTVKGATMKGTIFAVVLLTSAVSHCPFLPNSKICKKL